ncbi:LuxR family two component transcriptional regulator [Nonlabens dokdonensis]|uniref:Two component transcriptional regulator, LuxR family protein n=2 Tax=Nonlabens dokdonensis TaxID=328515 RepID=L7WAU3_NONDD|nr:response regulator transcription factor [Nonlabens dokdonensis]AGC77001.1 two component transcriptional regulator, LuxR family protein [Nonlabens dokdonensis DSW-6]PZX36902.1 LuxR family two component transcriptional regulator [Nonlabens dokdonensis]
MTLSPRILIADDHPMLLRGLEDTLKFNGYNVIASLSDGATALQMIKELEPDIAILDIEMPLLSGFEIIQKARLQEIKTKFIILTSHKEKGFIAKADQLQIDGYVLKDEPFEELKNCIEAVRLGNCFYSNSFTDIIDNQVKPELARIKQLSASEKIILGFIAKELSSKDIAQELSISIRTVQKHRTNIISKLELSENEVALKDWVREFQQFL